MTNPYESPANSSDACVRVSPTSSAAFCLFVLYGGSAICWVTFVHGLDLAFSDMFGGPAPPQTIWVFVASAAFGVVAMIAGCIYFARRRKFGASVGGLISAGLTMVGTVLPLLFTTQGLLQELAR